MPVMAAAICLLEKIMRTVSCGILVTTLVCLLSCSGQKDGDTNERSNVILVMVTGSSWVSTQWPVAELHRSVHESYFLLPRYVV